MAYRFEFDLTVPDNVRAVAHEQLDDAVRALDRALDGDDVDEQVHRVRRRCKQVRALTRLVRGQAPHLHRRENAVARDAARLVAPRRDATAVLDVLGSLATGPDGARDAVAAVEGLLREARTGADEPLHDRLRRCRQLLMAQRERATGWRLTVPLDALAQGWARTYGQGRRAAAACHDAPSTAAFHEWRKRTKDHRYHCQLLAPTWPTMLLAREQELHRLTDLLGDDHDLAVLRGVLADHGGHEAVRLVLALADRRRAHLQHAAMPLGARLYAATPRQAAGELRTWWRAWQEEAHDAHAPALAWDPDAA